MGRSKKIVSTDMAATVRDCPALKRLMPECSQLPPIDPAIEKQKQSENPRKKEQA